MKKTIVCLTAIACMVLTFFTVNTIEAENNKVEVTVIHQLHTGSHTSQFEIEHVDLTVGESYTPTDAMNGEGYDSISYTMYKKGSTSKMLASGFDFEPIVISEAGTIFITYTKKPLDGPHEIKYKTFVRVKGFTYEVNRKFESAEGKFDFELDAPEKLIRKDFVPKYNSDNVSIRIKKSGKTVDNYRGPIKPIYVDEPTEIWIYYHHISVVEVNLFIDDVFVGKEEVHNDGDPVGSTSKAIVNPNDYLTDQNVQFKESDKALVFEYEDEKQSINLYYESLQDPTVLISENYLVETEDKSFEIVKTVDTEYNLGDTIDVAENIDDKFIYIESTDHDSSQNIELPHVVTGLTTTINHYYRPVSVEKPNTYSVTFHVDKDTNKTVDVKAGELVNIDDIPETLKKGFLFKGWSEKEQTLVNEFNPLTDVINESKNYYAIYEVDGSGNESETLPDTGRMSNTSLIGMILLGMGVVLKKKNQ